MTAEPKSRSSGMDMPRQRRKSIIDRNRVGLLGYLILAAAASAACDPERARPGPPRIDIQFPAGSNVLSPDTLPVNVIAQDEDGLDSVLVEFLSNDVRLDGEFRSEQIINFFFPVPGDLTPGEMLIITATARDIRGDTATTTATVTVLPTPPDPNP